MKKRTMILLSSMVIVALVISGCGKKKGEDFNPEISFSGSSTLAPVISALAVEFSQQYETWDQVDSAFPQEEIAIYVSGGGSGAGVKAVIEASSDFGMLARQIKDEEKEKLGEMEAFTLGIDALTVAINPDNPLSQIKDNLSSEEIRKIFSGEYQYWDQVDEGLDHREIVVVIRDLGGGAHGVFQKSIMGETDVREDAIQAPSMGALVTKIIENKDAIGYASFGMVNQNLGKLTPLKVDGVQPIKENIIDGSYQISRPLIVVKKGNLRQEEKFFMDMVTSIEGRRIIEEMGFVAVE